MAINTLQTLKDAITSWTRRSELSSADLANMISLFESRLNSGFRTRDGRFVKLRIAQMEAAVATGNTVSGTATITLPSDWLETRAFAVSIGGVYRDLEFQTLEQLPGQFVANGPPMRYMIANGAINMGPTPDAAYAYSHYYYKKIPVIAGSSDTATTNTILTAYPQLYLFGSCVEVARQSRDLDKLAVYEQTLEQILDEVSSADRAGRFPKSPRMDFNADVLGAYPFGSIESGFM